MGAIISFLEGNSVLGVAKAPWMGFLLCFLLFGCMFGKALMENHYFELVVRGGWQLRSALSTAVYGKALRLTAAARQTKTIGEIVNLMQIDAGKLEMFVSQLHVTWDGAYQITGYVIVLIVYINWAALIGLVVMILAMPVQKKVMVRLFMLSRMMVKDTDQRVKVTNECLQGMLCLKMYAWEDSFIAQIESYRQRELTQLKKIAYLRAFARCYMMAVPAVVSVVSLSVYAVAGGDVSPSILFAALAAFNQLRFPLMFYPMTLAQYATMKVSQARLAEFLSMPELTAGVSVRKLGNSADAEQQLPISIKGAVVSWGVTQSPGSPDGDKKKDEKKNLNESKEEPVTSVEKNNAAEGKDANAEITAIADEDKESAQAPKSGESGETVTITPQPVLTGINLDVNEGELIAVIGPVGCGKSALCNMLLGEMKHLAGECSVRGSIGYAAQTAWILNATIEQNITFGMPMDQERYRRVIRACQLEHDLEILDSGDQTMIGERGINLSGGQKQRVSVARAAYSDKDIIILDDPMSALDPEVGGALFRECILGELKRKTRILVTHSMDILRQCDRILVLDTKAGTGETADTAVGESLNSGIGRIREQGTFDELLAAGLDFARLIGKGKKTEDNDSEGVATAKAVSDATRASRSGSVDSNTSITKDTTKAERALSTDSVRSRTSSSSKSAFKKEGKKLMEKEEREKGAVNCHVYAKYIVAGGGFCWAMFVFFWYIVAAGITVMNTAWVSVWTADSGYKNNSLGFYLGGLAVVALLLSIASFLRSVTMALTNVAASGRMHTAALRSVMTAPMGFFDVTPIGRIISRFSKDLHTMDEELGSYFDFFIWCSLYVVATFVVITVATPWFGLFIIPLLAIYITTVNYFRPVNREAKRLESIARSPVYAHFSETLGGLSTIRAFGDSHRFITTNMELVDESIRGFYIMKTSDRWLSVRLEVLGAVIALAASCLAVIQSITTIEGFSKNFASIAGLSISFAVGVTGLLNWTVRSFAQMEAGMNCAERILHYTENIPQERLRGDETSTQVSEQHKFRKEAWPKDGTLVIKNLSMRYREGTDLVLRNVSFNVESGQRIGVVGRTGAGKSSLMLALLRLVEPEAADESGKGPITWDGMDTTRVPVKVLRKRIGIIPQTPTLFSGTIRSNLDPFSDHSDDALWSALERCELRQAVEAMDGGLDAKVAEYGENMSQGQRQLLCLGRALLKDCHLLLLDEATSSIDRETDALVQRTIANSFEGCTILTIAHRVETVIENDKILVLDAGKVVEFDTPFALLKEDGGNRSQSAFANIVMETGEAQYANLLQMAKVAQEHREVSLDVGEGKVETTTVSKPVHRGSTYHKRAASVAPPTKGTNLTPPPEISIPRVPTAPSNLPVTPITSDATK